MIERGVINGRAATIAYIDGDWEPTVAARATSMKVIFDDDSEVVFLNPRTPVADRREWDEEKHPRDEEGKWTSGGGVSSGTTPTPRQAIRAYIERTTFYHGTRRPFEFFSHSAQIDRPDGAFMFTPTLRVAKNYSTIEPGGNPRVAAVKLKLENPKLLSMDEIGTVFEEDADRMKAEGYDGVVAFNSDGTVYEIGVFDSDQIEIINHNETEEQNPDEVMTPAEVKRHHELEESYKTHTQEEAEEYKALSKKFDERWALESAKAEQDRLNDEVEERRHFLHQQASLVANNLGFDPSRIDVVSGTRTFDVNGVTHTAAGDADIYNADRIGRIRLYQDQLTIGTLNGVTAHEIEHFKFQDAIDRLNSDSRKIQSEPGPPADPNHPYYWGRKGGLDAVLAPGDGLREPYASKYPDYNRLHNAWMAQPWDDFAEGDGVSQYSAEYWKAFKDGKATYQIAMHETLAEMARIKYDTGKFPAHFGYSNIIDERLQTKKSIGLPVPFQQADPVVASHIASLPDKPTAAQRAKGEKLWRNLYRLVDVMYKERHK